MYCGLPNMISIKQQDTKLHVLSTRAVVLCAILSVSVLNVP